MVDIVGKTIHMTRGDTLRVTVGIKQRGTDTPYYPQEGDVVRFRVKRSFGDTEALIEKIIPNDTLELKLKPSDTKDLAFGSYVYDIKCIFADENENEDEDVDTFIAEGTLVLGKST